MEQILNILGSVGFNWHVALANFVNFLIILFVLNRFVFKKIGKVISSREEVIKEGIENAEKAKEELAKVDHEKEKIIAHAEKEGHEIIHKANTKAELQAVAIEEKAEEKAHSILREAEEIKAKAKQDAEKEFSKTLPKMVADLTAKSLRENMTEDLNNALISGKSK